MRLRSLGLALFCLAASGAALAAAPRPLRFEELAKVRRVGAFTVSPDGKLVAFAVATPDVAANTSRGAIWIVSTAGGAARRVTSGEKRDDDPKFSPDGRRIAFLSSREKGPQIWVLDLAGGDPVRATSFPTGVSDYTWTPDGKWFVIASDVFPECSEVACLDKTLQQRETAKVKGRVAERLLFRHWDSWKDGTRSHLWKVPATEGGGTAVDLTPGDRDAPPFHVGGGVDWDVSPDGRELVYASDPDKDEALSTNSDLWAVPLEGGAAARNLTAGNRAFDGTPRISPDGRWIAYRAQTRAGFEADRFRLRLLERSTGQTRDLTEAFDFWVDDFRWAPDSKTIYFASQVRGRENLYRIAVAGGAPVVIWTGGTVAGLGVAGNRLVFGTSTLSRPAELWTVGAEGTAPAALTHVNDAQVGEIALGAVSERFTDASDRRKLQAWVVTPPGFDASKKYPAVFFIHGGPQGAWVDGWSYRWNPQVWAAYGYVVYAANPRGSTGFGQDFLDAISGDWGGQVYDDLMRQADDLAALPYVDRTKIAAAGASYGGYMVNWIAGHTDRFAALVSHDGTFDLASANLETEELWFPNWEFKGWPWSSDLYRKWNPMESAGHFKTPMLVITSERDYRVPFGQGLQLFTALQIRGVPSKLLTFPDEGHWVLKPGNSCLWHNTVMDWLHRWIGGAEADPKGLALAYSVTK
ncbi:MAG TPA: S9 family peptidase [Thermoanaerobaculia bacterium]|nr:S9 family peptidase [Thermoanaerobaculia bacterium]